MTCGRSRLNAGVLYWAVQGRETSECKETLKWKQFYMYGSEKNEQADARNRWAIYISQ